MHEECAKKKNNEKKRQWRKEHPELQSSYVAKHFKKHPEQLASYQKRYEQSEAGKEMKHRKYLRWKEKKKLERKE